MASKQTILAHRLRFNGGDWNDIIKQPELSGRTKQQLQTQISKAINRGELPALPKGTKVSSTMLNGLPAKGLGKIKKVEPKTKKVKSISKVKRMPSLTEVKMFLQENPDLGFDEFYKRLFITKKDRSTIVDYNEIITRMNS